MACPLGTGGRGMAQHGVGWHCVGWHCTAWYGTARHGMARHAMAQHGMGWHGIEWDGMGPAWNARTTGPMPFGDDGRAQRGRYALSTDAPTSAPTGTVRLWRRTGRRAEVAARSTSGGSTFGPDPRPRSMGWHLTVAISAVPRRTHVCMCAMRIASAAPSVLAPDASAASRGCGPCPLHAAHFRSSRPNPAAGSGPATAPSSFRSARSVGGSPHRRDYRCDRDSSVALSAASAGWPGCRRLVARNRRRSQCCELSPCLGHASVGRLWHAINRLVHTTRMDESACCSCMLKRKVLRLPRAIGLCVTHVAALETPSE